MNRKVVRLALVISALGLPCVAGCQGDAGAEPDQVLGLREGGRGTTFTDEKIEALCEKMLACAPADILAAGVTVGNCEDSLESLFDDIVAQVRPACADAYEDLLACVAANSLCVAGELTMDACAAEDQAGAAACEEWESDADPFDYIDVEQVMPDEEPTN
jgi:hypothetical protein